MNFGVNVLITSAGRRNQLVRSFQRVVHGDNGKILVADASRLTPTSHVADKTFVVPPVESTTYIESLLEICEKQSVHVLVPTIDTELGILSLARDNFADIGVSVLISSPECIHVSSDKKETNKWLRVHGFPVPQQWLLGEFLKGERELPFPLFVKPASGSRSIGAQTVHRHDDLLRLDQDRDFIVQELIMGVEYTVSTYVDLRGRCLAAVPRQRLEVRDGEVSKAVTRHHPEMENMCANIVESLPNAWGPMNVQVIADSQTDELKIIEINPRFGGGDPLAWEAGADAPKWVVMEVLGQRPKPTTDWTRNLAMLRFDDAIFTSVDG